ncbi:MAG: UDP-N-acetylmuramate dehydrogenase [Patescibacteria group bacterium]
MANRRKTDSQIEKIKGEFKDALLKVKTDEPLSKYTTFCIGGPAKFYVEVGTESEIQSFLKIIRKYDFPLFVIGAGSNLLVSDKGFDGIVLRLKGDFADIEFTPQDERPESNVEVRVGAGTMLQLLVKRSVDYGYTGFESLIGIPGTVGGALVSNAGTSKGTISEFFESATIIDIEGSVKTLKKNEVQFGYRSSNLEGKIILWAEFLIKSSTKEEVLQKINENLLERTKTQPLGTFNAGSIFKNPEGKFAGQLIEECGLKGYRVGGASVSEKHANFILNNGKATSRDVQQIINEVRKKVLEKSGIKLDLEIKIV